MGKLYINLITVRNLKANNLSLHLARNRTRSRPGALSLTATERCGDYVFKCGKF